MLMTDDIAYDSAEEVRALLRRLGRSEELTELHELAYAEGETAWTKVCAPVDAWRELFEALAAAEPQLVDESGSEAAAEFTWVKDSIREAALAMVRRWARLPTIREPRSTDEVSRLRSVVELAAEALDDAGRSDQALRIRRAAYPHRFSSEDRITS